MPCDDDDRPRQITPTGVEIPVPKREDFLRDLKKAAPKPPAKPLPEPGAKG